MTDKNLSTKPADNYKNTPMGKAVQKKYADILHGSRPEPSYRHPRMTLSNRAKIFSPFAALRGYEEEIAAEGEEHLKVTKIFPRKIKANSLINFCRLKKVWK